MIDYSKFDAALLAEIQRRPGRFAYLITPKLREMAQVLALQDAVPALKGTYPIFDRRLQALRRAGKIRYTGKVWEADHGKA